MPSFFSDDDRCGNDLGDMFEKTPQAIKQGFALGYLFALPFLAAAKIVEKAIEPPPPRPRVIPTTPPPEIHDKPPKFSKTYNWTSPPPQPKVTDPLARFRSVLGVDVSATKGEIKKRYRFLCHAFHPDKVADHMKAEAEEEFKRIHEAYTILIAVARDDAAPRGPGTTPGMQRPKYM